MPREKKTICDMHQEIIQLCSEILSLKFDHVRRTKRQVLSRVKKIAILTAKSRVAGQSMENRLNEYYDAITSVGFKREK